MSALLRAEWLRFRRRRDLWVIAIAVLVISGIAFLNGYKTDVTDPTQMTADEIRAMVSDPFYFGGDPSSVPSPEQITEMVNQQLADQAAQLADWNASQLLTLQKYDVGQSALTIIGFGVIPLIAWLLIATLIVGDEFRFGTVRTSLIASSPRRPFLAARLVTIVVTGLGLYGALAALGIVLSLVLHLVGAELPPATVALDPLASIATILGLVLCDLAILALAVALVVLFRSGAIPFLLVVILGAGDAFVASLPVFIDHDHLVAPAQLSLTTSIRILVTDLAPSTGALVYSTLERVPVAIELPSWAVALVVALWLAAFLALADRRFRTMDIVE